MTRRAPQREAQVAQGQVGGGGGHVARDRAHGPVEERGTRLLGAQASEIAPEPFGVARRDLDMAVEAGGGDERSISPVAATVEAPGACPETGAGTSPPERSKVPRKATSDQSSRPSATLSALRSRSSSIGKRGGEAGGAPRQQRPPARRQQQASRSRRRVRNSSPARGARRSIRPVPDRRTALPPGSSSRVRRFWHSRSCRAPRTWPKASAAGNRPPAGPAGRRCELGRALRLGHQPAAGFDGFRLERESGIGLQPRQRIAAAGELRASAPSALIVPVARWNGLPATIPSASQGPASAGAFSRTSSAENISLGAAPSWTVATERRRTLSASITRPARALARARQQHSASCATGRVTRARSITVPVKRTSPFSSGARAISASTVWASSAGPSSAPRISRSKRGAARAGAADRPALAAGRVPRDWVIAGRSAHAGPTSR